MKLALFIISVFLDIVAIILVLNLLGLPVNISHDCSVGSLLMVMGFFYLPIIIFISIICYLLIVLLSKMKIIKQISFAILILTIVFKMTFLILRIQVSSSDYKCPEFMTVNYDEVL